MFRPRSKHSVITTRFPCFTLDGANLKYVSQFRYLGQIIYDTLHDDNDIKREIRNLFVRTNMLINRFNKCLVNVKLVLFKSFCMNMYGLALWKHYSVTVFNKLKSRYYKCIKKFFAFKRMDSMSSILIDLSLPSINTVVHSKLLFDYRCANTCNAIAKWFYTIGV